MPQWGRKSYARIPELHKLPNLIEVQLDSFEWFRKEGLAELFDEISPIESFNKGMRLYFPGNSPEAREWGLKYWFETPKYGIEECLERDITFAAPLYVSVLLIGPEVPEPIKQDIFIGDMPLMTEKGTFIVNGSERVVVSQLPLAGRLFRGRRGPHQRPTPGLRQAHPRPRGLDGVRNSQVGLPHPALQSQAHRPGDDAAARHDRHQRWHRRVAAARRHR
jgi:DNA-directed RNA polymerase beta subunit